jgi:hypothetical protein
MLKKSSEQPNPRASDRKLIPGRRARTIRKTTFGIAAAALAGSILLAVFALVRMNSNPPAQPAASFDVRACVRLLHISRVYSIQQDESNADLLWFATGEGVRVLNRTTLEWQRYGLEHRLPSEIVSDVCFSQGRPCVATWDGAAWFDSLAHEFRPIKRSGTVMSNRILAIEDMPGSGLFFSVDHEGLFFTPSPDSPAVHIPIPDVEETDWLSCLKALDGKLYIGIEDQRMVVYDPIKKVFAQVHFAIPQSFKTLIWDILAWHGKFFVATSDNGIWVADSLTDTLRQLSGFPAKGAYRFAPEADGFWCGTPFGLWRYYADGGAWMQFVHPDEKEQTDFQVVALAATEDEVWYGSMDLGAGYLNKQSLKWFPLRAGLSKPNIAALAVADTFVWTAYGYQEGFLDRFSATDLQYDKNFGYSDGIMDPAIQTLAPRGTRVYYGGFAGFGYYDYIRRTGSYFSADSALPHPDIAQIAGEEKGPLYLGSTVGVIAYHPSNDSFARMTTTERYRITSLYKSGDSLWFGTLINGVGLCILSSGSCSIVCPKSSRIAGIVPVIDSSGATKIFAASQSNGCVIIDPGTLHYTSVEWPGNFDIGKPGQSSCDITAACASGGDVWLGTREQGCLVYRSAARAWKRFTILDGLISNQVKSFWDSDRFLWIGSYGGVNRIDKKYLAERLR